MVPHARKSTGNAEKYQISWAMSKQARMLVTRHRRQDHQALIGSLIPDEVKYINQQKVPRDVIKSTRDHDTVS